MNERNVVRGWRPVFDHREYSARAFAGSVDHCRCSVRGPALLRGACAHSFPALLQPTTASGTESTEAKYGLMSTSGVPSRQSRPMTDSVVPSTRTSFTTLIAIGFGRTGERTENVPRGSL